MLRCIALILLVFGSVRVASGEPVQGAGASFPFPIYSSWAYHYQQDTNLKINYQSIGSGGGINQISSRTVDFGASDDPLKPERLLEKDLLQFPAVIGGVVPVVNLKNVSRGALKLTPDQLAGIFLGKIKNWNDPRIKRTNPDTDLPKQRIMPVHRSDSSGTTAIFTYYLSLVSREWKQAIGHGKKVQWPAGIAGKGNEGVANYVKRLKNTIGYTEFSYAKNNGLAFICLQNQTGNFITPSYNSFKAAALKAKLNADAGFYGWLVNAPGEKSWPIAGASYILLAREHVATNRMVIRFFDWAFKHGDQKAIALAYVPLPEKLKTSIRNYWKRNRLY